MKFPTQATRTFFARALLSMVMAGVAASMAGCGRSGDDEAPANATSKKAADSKGGLTIKGDGLNIEAFTSTSLLPGFSRQPLSVRIMSGWVNTERLKLVAQEKDQAKKQALALGNFGLLTVQIAADKAEPGNYQLLPTAPKVAKGSASETGTVIIDKAKDAGLPDAYTSQSGTLTIKAVTKDDRGMVTGVEGAFDGKFASDAGDSRAYSSNFRFTPTK